MQRRLAEEFRALDFDSRSQTNYAWPGGIRYRNSIERIVSFSAAANTASLVFPSSGSSIDSSASLSSAGSEVPTPGSGCESYKILRMEAFRDLSKIASHMVNDGYTGGLITEFSRRQRQTGGDEILRTWFSDLGVDWVLGVDEMNLREVPWSAVEELIKKWVVAFAVMAEALRLTRPGLRDDGDSDQGGIPLLSSDGGSDDGGLPLLRTENYGAHRSAPAGAAPTSAALPIAIVSPDSSDTDQGSSGSTQNRSFVVASVREAIKAYSHAEKRHLFKFDRQGQGAETELQFALFAEASLMKMLRFPDAVASLESSPEKIVRMIDIYSLVSDVTPGLLVLLTGDSNKLVSDRIATVLETMSHAVRHILHNLISLIQKDDSWKTVQPQQDDIHPITRYVLNYINLLLENYVLLNSILQRNYYEVFFIDGLYNDSGEHPSSTSSLTDIISELVNSLDAMLDDKSKVHTVGGRRYIFLLNNTHFILQQSEPSLQGLLGAYWSASRKRQIERHIKSYIDTSWGPVISCFQATNDNKQRKKFALGKVSALVDFSTLLQITYHKEKFWKINSPQLRGELRKSVSSKVTSAYRGYLESHAELKMSAACTPEDLEDIFEDLFEG